MARKFLYLNYLVINVSGDTVFIALNVNGIKMERLRCISMNYNQFTKQELIKKIINTYSYYKSKISHLWRCKKNELIGILERKY